MQSGLALEAQGYLAIRSLVCRPGGKRRGAESFPNAEVRALWNA